MADSLRAGPAANPPSNMRKELIFTATFALSVPLGIFVLKGRQVRREVDEREAARGAAELVELHHSKA